MPESVLASIIIPTYNEEDNIASVIRRSSAALDQAKINYEILVIDDSSTDHTARVAADELAGRGRVVSRGRQERGLSLSVMEGIRQSRGELVVVLDGDGSHPPELIPEMVRYVQSGYELVIASRYVKGGGTEKFPLHRRAISRFSCFLGRLVTDVRDNTSGFFCVKKKALGRLELTAQGFKIGLEIFVKARPEKFIEIPYTFANRQKGRSKLGLKASLQFILQIIRLIKDKKRKS